MWGFFLRVFREFLPKRGRSLIGGLEWYNFHMTNSKSLRSNYEKYRRTNRGRKGALGFLRSFMPEMIFRTTKLEGEPITRKMVRAIFG